MADQITKRTEELTWRYMHDLISEKDFEELQKLISSDKDARSKFFSTVAIHSCLRDEFLAQELDTSVFQSDHHRSVQDVYGIDVAQSPGILRNPYVAACLSAAATLLIVGGFQWFSPAGNESAHLSQGEKKPPITAPSVYTGKALDAPGMPIATVTGAVDCKWKDASTSAAYGEVLDTERKLELLSGFIQLTFDSGAKVLLQGPVSLSTTSHDQAVLNEGKLTAAVPRRASGFTIRTPTAEIVDIGTAFGVRVNELRESEVHVLEGEVHTRALNEIGDPVSEIVRITDQQAYWFGHDPSAAKAIRYDGGSFVRDLEPRLTKDELPKLPVLDGLALWLAADVFAKTDSADSVIAWRDILAGDNQAANDALQQYESQRPKWVDSAIGGQPALRFSGEQYLTTTPFVSTDNQSVFAVFQLNENSLRNSGAIRQIINFNGPPQPNMYITNDVHVLQISAYCGSAEEPDLPGQVKALVYSRRGEHEIISGVVDSLSPPIDVPLCVSYIYDFESGQAQLFMNSKLAGTKHAETSAAINSRKLIGRRASRHDYFIGDIGEIIIFNRAVSPEERQAIESYLAKKYGT
ncbi:MAG: FecR domain-containing protein [Pirellulales bacterium]|nr:FecR domain-containing protein [Pirellulales bacterium]